MSPRTSASEARQTKARIVDAGVALASTAGLEGMTIGSLSQELGMSKAGVLGPFGSKSRLQAAVLARALDSFVAEVVTPTLGEPRGLPRLLAAIDRWTDYLAHGPFPNGCFVFAASCELDGQPGPLRDQLRDAVVAWEAFLTSQITTARNDGQVRADLDPEDAVATLVGLAMAANQRIQLLGDGEAASRARRLMRAAVLGPVTPVGTG
jgi:AcrR family transcriptional regulator